MVKRKLYPQQRGCIPLSPRGIHQHNKSRVQMHPRKRLLRRCC